MKKLLILLVLIAGCKKKDTPPTDPEPTSPPATITPTITPTCHTGLVRFTGRYVCERNDKKDTIEFVFRNNNCPVENSNWYVIKNFVNTTNSFAITGEKLSPNMEFEMVSTEQEFLAQTKLKDYTFKIQTNGDLVLTSKKLNYGFTNFFKVK